MTETLWKVTRPDGTPWHGDGFVYEAGKTYRRRDHGEPRLCSPTVLHAARTPEQAARFGSWPYVLWEVEGVVAVEDEEKVGVRQLTVVRQAPTHLCFGPQGEAVLRVVERAGRLTVDEADALSAAWSAARSAAESAARSAAESAAWYAAWSAARSAARSAAESAAWSAARSAAESAAWSAARSAAESAAWSAAVADLVGQHGLTQEHIDLLRKPWADVIGPTWEVAR